MKIKYLFDIVNLSDDDENKKPLYDIICKLMKNKDTYEITDSVDYLVDNESTIYDEFFKEHDDKNKTFKKNFTKLLSMYEEFPKDGFDDFPESAFDSSEEDDDDDEDYEADCDDDDEDNDEDVEEEDEATDEVDEVDEEDEVVKPRNTYLNFLTSMNTVLLVGVFYKIWKNEIFETAKNAKICWENMPNWM